MANADIVVNVMALDSGLANTGLVVAGIDRQGNIVILHAECLCTEREAKARRIYVTDDYVRRVTDIARAINANLKKYKPVLIVAELPVSGGKSASAHFGMGVAVTLAATIAELSGVPMRNYCWDDGKFKMTGRKSAGKDDVQTAVLAKYPVLKTEKYDFINKRTQKPTGKFEHVADAIAVLECGVDSDVIKALIRNSQNGR